MSTEGKFVEDPKNPQLEESKTELQSLVEKAKGYLYSHPELIYKGLPLVWLAYMSMPIFLTLLYWLPWIWIGWEISNKILTGSIPLAIAALKQFLSLVA